MDDIEGMKDYKPYKDVEPEIVKERKEYGADKLIEGETIGKKIGFDKGEKNKAIDMAKSMLADNMDIKIIAKHTGFSKKEVLKIKENMGL